MIVNPFHNVRTRHVALAALAAVMLGVALLYAGRWATGTAFLLAGLGMLVLLGHRRLRPARTRAQLRRYDRHTGRHAGTASWWDVASTSSAWAMRRRAAVLRPSLRAAGRWQRWRTPVLSYATPLARVGRQRVWTSVEESTLRVGIPGTGKTAELVCRVVDAPGGVVVTSTATDLYEMTVGLRRRRGPVAVFNPGGIGGVPSTLRWSPLAGCTDPGTAARRAADLMGPAGAPGSEGERWAVQGRRALAVFLHAAALGGQRIRDVHAWTTNPEAGRTHILDALMESPQAVEMCRAADQIIGMNPRTRDGVLLAIAPALAWVTLPAAAAVGDPDAAVGLVAVHDLVDERGALYLLGDDDGTIGPLVGALTAEVAHQARAAAAVRPGGRLDPALTLVLDEVALICPVPLDRWLAELRKRSIVAHVACQGLGQLRQRWGDNGASMILNSAAAVLVYGGCKDPNDLNAFGQLAGERDEPTDTRDADGRVTSRTTRRMPVIPPSMLAGLPNHRALLIRRGMPVALCRTPIGWKRRDVRRALAAEVRTVRTEQRAANTTRTQHAPEAEPARA
jgi:type IV secretion system protein VirD4